MSDRTALPVSGTRTVASALLLDDATLAALARTTLAAADVATVVGAAPEQVRVVDRDGEPELSGLSEALRAQVGRGRRVTLIVSPRADDGVWLVLDGRLVARDGATALAVEAVWVGCPHGHGHARPLDLTDYATAVPDALRAAIPRLLEHTNADHGPELRDLARRRLGINAEEIAGAALTDLDVDGVTLRVVDLDGGSQVRLPFVRRASAACELLGLLRLVLTAP